ARALGRGCRKDGWASRRIWRGRSCSWPRRRPVSTPPISSMPTAATRRAKSMATKARIAVLGAGLMGHGIAQVFALAGHAVTIYDPVAASLAQVRSRVAANLRDLGDDEAAAERVEPCA